WREGRARRWREAARASHESLPRYRIALPRLPERNLDGHVRPGRRRGLRGLVARVEIRREVTAGDLGRRPPQRLGRRLAVAVAAGDLAREEVLLAADQEHPAQH